MPNLSFIINQMFRIWMMVEYLRKLIQESHHVKHLIINKYALKAKMKMSSIYSAIGTANGSKSSVV